MNSSLLKITNNLRQNGVIGYIVRSDIQLPVIEVVNMPRTNFVGANKSQSACNGNSGQLRQKIFFQTVVRFVAKPQHF